MTNPERYFSTTPSEDPRASRDTARRPSLPANRPNFHALFGSSRARGNRNRRRRNDRHPPNKKPRQFSIDYRAAPDTRAEAPEWSPGGRHGLGRGDGEGGGGGGGDEGDGRDWRRVHTTQGGEGHGGVRKKPQRFIRGGTIPKKLNVEEYTGGLYCEICNKHFRTITNKTLHERSRDHIMEMGRLRNEGGLQGRQGDDLSGIMQDQPHVRHQRLMKATEQFGKMDAERLPPAFLQWMNSSLQSAEKPPEMMHADQEQEEKSKTLERTQAIQREVVDVYNLAFEQCNLWKTSWVQKPLATGQAYHMDVKYSMQVPEIADEFVKQREKELEEMRKANEKLAEQERQKKETAVVPTASIPASAEVPKEEPKPIADQPSPVEHAVQVQPTEIPEYPVISVRWNPPSRARQLAKPCMVTRRELLLQRYLARFGHLKMSKGTVANREGDSCRSDDTELERLAKRFDLAKRQFTQAVVGYEQLKESLFQLYLQYRDLQGQMESARRCLRLLANLAVREKCFSDCSLPLSLLVRSYNRGDVPKEDAQYVASWVLSWMLKSAKGASGVSASYLTRTSDAIAIVQEMRMMPIVPDSVLWVSEALRVVRAILHGNCEDVLKRKTVLKMMAERSNLSNGEKDEVEPCFIELFEALQPFFIESWLCVVFGQKEETNAPRPLLPIKTIQERLNITKKELGRQVKLYAPLRVLKCEDVVAYNLHVREGMRHEMKLRDFPDIKCEWLLKWQSQTFYEDSTRLSLGAPQGSADKNRGDDENGQAPSANAGNGGVKIEDVVLDNGAQRTLAGTDNAPNAMMQVSVKQENELETNQQSNANASKAANVSTEGVAGQVVKAEEQQPQFRCTSS